MPELLKRPHRPRIIGHRRRGPQPSNRDTNSFLPADVHKPDASRRPVINNAHQQVSLLAVADRRERPTRRCCLQVRPRRQRRWRFERWNVTAGSGASSAAVASMKWKQRATPSGVGHHLVAHRSHLWLGQRRLSYYAPPQIAGRSCGRLPDRSSGWQPLAATPRKGARSACWTVHAQSGLDLGAKLACTPVHTVCSPHRKTPTAGSGQAALSAVSHPRGDGSQLVEERERRGRRSRSVDVPA